MLPDLPEQPADWTEPGAFPATSGVSRVPLPLPTVGLRAVNVYVIHDPDGPVLVDSGWVSPEGASALVAGLRTLGYTPADVRRVVVTHSHHDHYTQALAMRARHGTEVLLGRGERPTVEAMFLRGDEPAPQGALLRLAGAPALAVEMTQHQKEQDANDGGPWGEPDRWLDDGERLPVLDRSLEVRATPGHTRGHVVLRDVAAGALFAGDHILPHITPSIGFERAPEPAPLRSYLDSLRLVRELPDTVLLPAHGPVTGSVHTRIDELLVHHEQRLAASLAQIRAGAETAYAVAGALRWTRREKRITELETEHAALAVLEIAAHLDVLVEAGELRVEESDGVRRYTVR